MEAQNIIDTIRRDPGYLAGLDWGKARIGHPEGAVRHHIAQLEKNLELIADIIPARYQEPLRLLIHTHDTFKYVHGEKIPLESPRSHASLAAEFLTRYTSDTEVIAVARHHDTLFACWCDYVYRGEIPAERIQRLFSAIKDFDFYATFLLIDGLTEGKHSSPVEWALARLKESSRLAPFVDCAFERLRLNARDEKERTLDLPALVEEKTYGHIHYRALGPIESWGADIYLSRNGLPSLRPVLQELAQASGQRYAGIIFETETAAHFHLSRYPGRAAVPVPSIESCRKGFHSLTRACAAAGIKVLAASEAAPVTEPGLQRATIGLVEGYTENRKRALLQLIADQKISSLEAARAMATQQLGSLLSHGIDLGAVNSLPALVAVLQKDLSKLHTAGEAEAMACGHAVVQRGRILSVASENYLYEEPCVVMTGRGPKARSVIFSVARAFAQARFTFESLTAHETVNIELHEFMGEQAAKMV